MRGVVPEGEHMRMDDQEQRQMQELIQVAAVVASILEAKLHGATDFDALITDDVDGGAAFQGWAVLELFADERKRQDAKWGDQESHGPITWAMILAEEIGEWAEELRIEDQIADMTATEVGSAAAVLKHLEVAGKGARTWLNAHEWPERQQAVFDEEEQAVVAQEERREADRAMTDEEMREANAYRSAQQEGQNV